MLLEKELVVGTTSSLSLNDMAEKWYHINIQDVTYINDWDLLRSDAELSSHMSDTPDICAECGESAKRKHMTIYGEYKQLLYCESILICMVNEGQGDNNSID